MYLLFQDPPSAWPATATIIVAIVGVIGVLATGFITYFAARKKVRADTAYVLVQTNEVLAKRLKAATEELIELQTASIPSWQHGIEASSKNARELADQAKAAEERAIKAEAEVERLNAVIKLNAGEIVLTNLNDEGIIY